MDRDEPTAPQAQPHPAASDPAASDPAGTGGAAWVAGPEGTVPPAPAPGSVWSPPPAGHDVWSPRWNEQGNQPGVAPVEVGAYPPPLWTAPPAVTPAPARPKHRIGRMVGAGVAALALVGAGVGLGAAVLPRTADSSSSVAVNPNSDTLPNRQFPGFGSGSDGTGGSDGSGSGAGGTDGTGSGAAGAGTADGTSSSVTSAATDAQSVGVVVIDTVLGYQDAQAAGTGMIIGSDGTVLTNNHVVEGSTSIRATVVSTGRTYNATVVGTDATDDVAVIKLTGASGLSTVSTDTTSNIAAGTAVVAVGNAGGTGSLTAATGTVTATGQAITATDESGTNAENLAGLLQTDAAIQSGDSGGPLFDSSGDVVGINTAAATSRSGATQAGYAIPIGNAVSIARDILAGKDTDTITIGLPAFLGVSVSTQASGDVSGAAISAVVAGLPAAQAGITGGDTITAIDGRTVSSASGLSDVMATLRPGQSVSVSWTSTDRTGHTAQVTLVEGPAD